MKECQVAISDHATIVARNLGSVLDEMESQTEVGKLYPPELMSFDEQMEQLRQYIEYAGEYAVAYESIVATLEEIPFVLSGPAAIKLLEVGLLMRYKTGRPEDSEFDNR